MSFSKVVLIIVTLIVLDYAQVAAQEDLQVAESKGKKYPRHIQPNVRPTQQRRRSFGRSNPVRGRSDSSENGGEENDPPGYVILSYGGRLGKGTKGQRYGNKYGSDYSVEYVGNLYGYEEGHGYGSGYNSGYNNGYNSGHSSVANIQHGTSTGDGSHESDGSKGNGEPMGDLSVVAVDAGSDGTKDIGGPMGDSVTIGENGTNEGSKLNADTVGEGTGTAVTDGFMAEEIPIVAVDAMEIEASNGKGEAMLDAVITSEDATLSIDGMEAGGETFGGEGVKITEAIGETVPLIDGDVTGSVVATKTVGTMDELMALLGDIGGSEGSTSSVKSMDDLMAIMGEAEGIEGISEIAGLTGDTTGIDGSTGNFETTGSVLDTFANGGQDSLNSGTAGSVEEGAASLSVEEEYTVSVDLVTEDETMDHVASGKITNANERNPFADSLVMNENGDLSSVTLDAVKASASYIDAASGAIITEESKSSPEISEIDDSFQPAEMVKAESLIALEEAGKMVIQTADMITMAGETEGTSLKDTSSAASSGSEQSSAPSIASEGTSNNLRRMARIGHDNRRPINYRNGDRRSIAVVKGHHPGNRARPQNRAISGKPVENIKYGNLPGNGEKIHSIHPGSARNVPMNKPSRQITTSGMPLNGGSRFRSIGEGNSAPRMKENGSMASKSVRSSPANGNIKAMPVTVEMVSKEAGSVNATPLTEHRKNAASSNPSGSAGSGKKRFLSMGKNRNTSGNNGKLESGSGSNKSAKHPSGSEERGKKASGNGDKINNHEGKRNTRPARPAQLMSPPPSEEMMPPKSAMGDTSKPDIASENQEQGESTSEKPSGKGKRAKKPKNSVKEKRQISGTTSGSSSSSDKGKSGSENGKGKETNASEPPGGIENVNGDEGRQNNGFVRNAPHNIVRYLRKGIGRYL